MMKMVKSMLLVGCVLLHWLRVIGSEMDHITSYSIPNFNKNKETFMTLEGGQPKVVRHTFRRFLSFNNDQSNIRVEMVFAVPFLQIPIGGKAVEGPFGNGVTPQVDVNTKSLVAASILLFMLFFVIPKVVRVFVPKFSSNRAFEDSDFSRMMRGVETALGVNTTACWQKAVCLTVQGGRQKSEKGNATSLDKIVDGFAGIAWLDSITAGSSFGEAWRSGKSDGDCSMLFTQCSLSQEKLGSVVKDLLNQYMQHLSQLTRKKNSASDI